MAKTWDELSQSEKIEDLRTDVLNLIKALNSSIESLKELGQSQIALKREQARMIKRVADLAKSISKASER